MSREVIVAPDPDEQKWREDQPLPPRPRRRRTGARRSEAMWELVSTLRGFLQQAGIDVEVVLHHADDDDLDEHVAAWFEAEGRRGAAWFVEVVRLDLVPTHGRRWHCPLPLDEQTARQCSSNPNLWPRGTDFGKREVLLQGLLMQVYARFWEDGYRDLDPPAPKRRRDERGRFLPALGG